MSHSLLLETCCSQGNERETTFSMLNSSSRWKIIRANQMLKGSAINNRKGSLMTILVTRSKTKKKTRKMSAKAMQWTLRLKSETFVKSSQKEYKKRISNAGGKKVNKIWSIKEIFLYKFLRKKQGINYLGRPQLGKSEIKIIVSLFRICARTSKKESKRWKASIQCSHNWTITLLNF